jgi:hypothetical protein
MPALQGYQIRSLWNKARYGLILQYVRDLLATIGIDIKLFYWVQEWVSDLSSPPLPDSLQGYSFEFFGPNEIKSILAGEDQGISEETMLRWLKEGKKCFGMKNGEEIVAVTWFDFAQSNFKGYPVEMKQNEVYLFNLYTLKKFRGNNLAPFLRYQSYQVLRKMGKNTFYSVSEYCNAPSIKFKKKLNSRFLKLGVSC